MKALSFSLLFLLLGSIWGYSQTERHYIDSKPQYRPWQSMFILDQIEYTPQTTIFYCRFVANNKTSGGGMFSPPDADYAFVLKGKKPYKTVYKMSALKNLRRDGILEATNVVKNSVVLGTNNKSGGETVFTFEVHFDDLPLDLASADLIEGEGQEFNTNNFNCFDIQLQTWSLPRIEDNAPKNTLVPEYPKPQPNNPERLPNLKTANDLQCGKQLVLNGLQFRDNSTDFKGEIAAKRTLFWIFQYLKEHPESILTLYGHTDVFGDPERNLELSKQRVIKVQRWLSMHGIPTRRVQYEFFGSKRPLYPKGNALNRRVEIRIDCP